MDVLQAIKERRSINFFDEPDKELPDEKIRELLELAKLAPSSMNLQPWRISENWHNPSSQGLQKEV